MADQPSCSQKFSFTESSECIQLITQNIQRVSKLVTKQVRKTLKEEDVNPEHLNQTHISEILNSVNETETNFHKVINSDNINKLLSLYQQVIEYYSAVNNPDFEIYLNKMHELLSNELIQDTLQGRINETTDSDASSFGFTKTNTPQIFEKAAEVELEVIDSENLLDA